MEQKKEKKYLIGSILCGLLTAFGIVAAVISLINGAKSNGVFILRDCVSILLYLAIIYYAFVGYKKPHGNMLKYIFLIRAALILVIVYTLVQSGTAWRVILNVIQIGLTCYIAGRLNKAKENLILMVIVTACIMTVCVIGVISGATIGVVSPLIIWLDICVAYFLRYKEHREAGLIDAPKNK